MKRSFNEDCLCADSRLERCKIRPFGCIPAKKRPQTTYLWLFLSYLQRPLERKRGAQARQNRQLVYPTVGNAVKIENIAAVVDIRYAQRQL